MNNSVPTSFSDKRLVSRTEIAEALKLLKDWSVWLVGIQTASIGAIAALVKDGASTDVQSTLAGIAVTMFLISIYGATHLLVALPAFYLRLPELSADDDFMSHIAFKTKMGFVKDKPLLWFVGAEQWPFLLGIFSFVLFVIAHLLKL